MAARPMWRLGGWADRTGGLCNIEETVRGRRRGGRLKQQERLQSKCLNSGRQSTGNSLHDIAFVLRP